MEEKNLLKKYPIRRISPEDGMAVTAKVWGEAHDYHHLQQRYHDLLQHGSGIISGLDVSAGQRPFTVELKPGIAIDPAGDRIVVPDTKVYEIGSTPGLLYLILSYGESFMEQKTGEGPRFILSECILQAVSELPNFPFVEVARITLANGAPIRNAIRPELPGPNELDLRFRPYALVKTPASNDIARIGVCYAGKQATDGENGHGAVLLARALRSQGQQVWVDDDISLEIKEARPGAKTSLDGYTLIYLVGAGKIQLTEREAGSLKNYVQRGGTVLVEPCRRDQPAANSPLYTALLGLAGALGDPLSDLIKGHPLLMSPHLFSLPPAGFDEGDARLQIGGGVIFSPCDYGCLWQGDRRSRAASREEIRAAEEWGENLLAYASQRRGEAAR